MTGRDMAMKGAAALLPPQCAHLLIDVSVGGG